jgi:hypothetical protein
MSKGHQLQVSLTESFVLAILAGIYLFTYLLFKMDSCCVALVGLAVMICLLQPPE